MIYGINPPTPAGISLATGEYHALKVYRKSTQWIYIVEKPSSALKGKRWLWRRRGDSLFAHRARHARVGV